MHILRLFNDAKDIFIGGNDFTCLHTLRAALACRCVVAIPLGCEINSEGAVGMEVVAGTR